MAQQSCGASVQCCALRVAVLELDGVPVPGASNLYVTDAISKLEATPVYTKGVDMEVLNACGIPAVTYKARDVFKRYDLTMDLINIDPELDAMLIGTNTYKSGAFTIGASSLDVAVIGAPYGVSIEAWSKHIVSGDLDPTWPYVQWVFPRTYWQPDKVTLDNNAMPRSYTGFTSENINYFNGPMNDWTFLPTDRSMMWRLTKTIPTPACGAQALVSS